MGRQTSRPIEHEIYYRIKNLRPNDYPDVLYNEKKHFKDVVKHPGAQPVKTRLETIELSRKNTYEQIAKIYEQGRVESLTINYSPARESYEYENEDWYYDRDICDEVRYTWTSVAAATEEKMTAIVVYTNINYKHELNEWKINCDRHARSVQSNKEARERIQSNIEHNRSVIREAIRKDLTLWRTVAKELKETKKNETQS